MVVSTSTVVLIKSSFGYEVIFKNEHGPSNYTSIKKTFPGKEDPANIQILDLMETFAEISLKIYHDKAKMIQTVMYCFI